MHPPLDMLTTAALFCPMWAPRLGLCSMIMKFLFCRGRKRETQQRYKILGLSHYYPAIARYNDTARCNLQGSCNLQHTKFDLENFEKTQFFFNLLFKRHDTGKRM